MVDVQTSTRLKGIQTYGGGDHNSLDFQTFLKDEGFNHQITSPICHNTMVMQEQNISQHGSKCATICRINT